LWVISSIQTAVKVVCSIAAAELSTATVETAIRESRVWSSVDAKTRSRRRRSVNWSKKIKVQLCTKSSI
jgi:hypothetical protein